MVVLRVIVAAPVLVCDVVLVLGAVFVVVPVLVGDVVLVLVLFLVLALAWTI